MMGWVDDYKADKLFCLIAAVTIIGTLMQIGEKIYDLFIK